MKTSLESNQKPNKPLVEGKQLFKAKLPDIYYGKLHMNKYHF